MSAEAGTFDYWMEGVADILKRERGPIQLYPDQFSEWIEAYWAGLDPHDAVKKLTREFQ
jgi:hypothetical protein